MTNPSHAFETHLSGSLAGRLRDEAPAEEGPAGPAEDRDPDEPAPPLPPAASTDDPPFGSLRFARTGRPGRDR